MEKARILLYDLETFPNIAYTWGKYEQDVIAFVKERMICSVAWRWLGEKKTHCLSLPDFYGYPKEYNDNSKLIKAFHEVISGSDVVIAHNGSRFDDKMLNADILKLNLEPPPPHKMVDTLSVARKNFRLNSNRLDDLGQLLKVGRKVKHEGFALWLKCMAGDKKAWAKMIRYNKQDVVLLERVYLRLRPWIVNHPDLGDYSRVNGCPNCESKRARTRGWSYASQSKRQRLKCLDCGRWYAGPRVKSQKD